MALYKYSKDYESVVDTKGIEKRYIDLSKDTHYHKNIWSSAADSYSLLQKIVDASKFTNIIVPLVFILIGVFFIYQHFAPDIKTQVRDFTYDGNFGQGTTTPVSETYIDLSKFVSNPAGLDTVAREAFAQDILQVDEVSRNYRGTFYISIPALDINRLPVQANVDSTTESAYLDVLTDSLAHFENTSLPISDVRNNIVIYGHSATSNYSPKPNDPEVAFTFLPNLKVGDEIILEMEGEEYRFKMQRSKIVEPDDLSIITGRPGKRQLTLFTCYPEGNSSHRYVAIARPV